MVKREESALRTRNSKELVEGKELDKAMLEEYHPEISVE